MRSYYSEGGLRKWVKRNGSILQASEKDGSYPKCGEEVVEKKKKYPKCVPIAKARANDKRAKGGCRKKKTSKSEYRPYTSRAATFAKKKKKT